MRRQIIIGSTDFLEIRLDIRFKLFKRLLDENFD